MEPQVTPNEDWNVNLMHTGLLAMTHDDELRPVRHVQVRIDPRKDDERWKADSALPMQDLSY